MSVADDLGRIEAILFGLWAPINADPKSRPAFVVDNPDDDAYITVHDVVRARLAFGRVADALTAKDDR